MIYDICNHHLDLVQGVTVNTMKGILEEMMTLFPDQYFHLGLDEVITTSVCTMESKSVEQSH